jgi:hypothetical protein
MIAVSLEYVFQRHRNPDCLGIEYLPLLILLTRVCQSKLTSLEERVP